MPKMTDDYMDKLRQKGKESHVYNKYQMVGLQLSQILGDEKHKALYIRLAKLGDCDALLRVAKNVADRKGIKNRGAYFMKLVIAEKPAGEKREKHDFLNPKNLFAEKKKKQADA